MKKYLSLITMALVFFAGNATAAYNANMKGVIKDVITYTDGDYIYFILENQPATHPTCNPQFFVIHESMPAERRSQLLTRLLSAYAMKEEVNIGYDAQGGCIHGYIQTHRVG